MGTASSKETPSLDTAGMLSPELMIELEKNRERLMEVDPGAEPAPESSRARSRRASITVKSRGGKSIGSEHAGQSGGRPVSVSGGRERRGSIGKPAGGGKGVGQEDGTLQRSAPVQNGTAMKRQKSNADLDFDMRAFREHHARSEP